MLLLVCGLLAWVGRPLRVAAQRDVPPTAGIGISSGVRSVAADVLWLRAYVAWERQDREALQELVRAVSAIDPRPLPFWLNSARMMAYDVPQWRLAEAAAGGYLPAAVRQRIVDQQVQAALRHLAQGRRFHPHAAALWVEEGQIQLNVRGDLAAAAAAYREAARQPQAPYYAARIYAELLLRLGRPAEAYDWLKALHPELDLIRAAGERERAMPDVVLERIRELERLLNRPDSDCYSPRRDQAALTVEAMPVFPKGPRNS